jgi:ferredoxin
MEYYMNYLKNVVTLKLDREKCTGCGSCLDVCPRRVLAEEENKVRIADRDSCIECGACQRNCAFGAITVESGVACAQAFFKAMFTGGEPVCGCESGKDSSTGCC